MYKENAKIGLRPHAGPLTARPAPPMARDPWMLAILGLALALQFLTLSRIDGYLLADSVEYMDRAAQVAGGAALDSSTVRSFAFSGLLTPLFWLTSLMGAPASLAVGLARALVMLLGLAAVWVTMRLGVRLFGRTAGLIAGFALATNPVFLQFGVEPLTGSAAALAVVLALDAATRPEASLRTGAMTGAWLGVALLFAFKTIPIAGVILFALVLAGRLQRRGLWLGAGLSYVGFGFAQCLLDKAVYGQFGGSLLSYLRANVGGVIGDVLLKLHALGVPGVYDAAVDVYKWTYGGESGVEATAETVTAVARSLTSKTWYLEHFTADFLAWPLAVGVVLGLGLALSLRRRRPGAALIAVLFLLNLAFLSIKPAKSFRLLIPLLPAIAILAGLGLSELLDLARRKAGRLPMRALAALALGWALVAGQVTLAHTNLTKYGAWWDAVDELEELARASGTTWTYASAYNWAVRFRDGSDLELVKLPHHMDRWADLTKEQHEETFAALEQLDGFLAHLQILTQDPRILATINARFEIHDILYDAASFEELGPLYVLKKRGDRPPQRSFFELSKNVDPGAYQASISHAHSVDFRRRQNDGPTLQMVLLGWDLETGLADGQLAWLTLHWYIGNTAGHDYTIVTRVTDRDDRAREGNHEPAHGAWPTSKLESGWILAESLEIPMPLDPAVFGGADARGDLIPASFWLGIAEFETAEDGSNSLIGGLNPFQPSGLRPLQKRLQDGAMISPDGYRWSPDGLFGVAGFWLPVPDGARLADDGRPVAANEKD